MIRHQKYIRLRNKTLVILLLFSFLVSPIVTPRAEANPLGLVIPAGIEAGVAAYVAGAVAVAGIATLVGYDETGEAIYSNAINVWNDTQQTMKDAITASVQASAAAGDWLFNMGYGIHDYFKTKHYHYEALPGAVLTPNDTFSGGASSYFPGVSVYQPPVGFFYYKGLKWQLIGIGQTNGKVYANPVGNTSANRSWDTNQPGYTTAYFNSLAWYQKFQFILDTAGAKYFRFSVDINPALPKLGDDYIIRVPPLTDFIPYPKAADGTPDKTKGPLVYQPDLNIYTGDQVYHPNDVTWDFPKPAIRTNTKTGAKEVSWTKVDPITGEITYQDIKDTTIETTPTVPGNPPINWNDTPTTAITFEPLKLAGQQLTNRFPFSIPWDIQKQLSVFDVAPKTPVLKVDKTINVFGTSMKMKFDISFAVFDTIGVIVRWFMIIAFDLGIILSVRRFMPE